MRLPANTLHAHNRAHQAGGFTLVEIMIVIAIIGLLAAVAIPNFIRYRNTAQIQACIKNLRTLDEAKQIWGVEYGKGDFEEPTEADLIGNDLYIKEMPACPASGSYTINDIATSPTCTISGHALQ